MVQQKKWNLCIRSMMRNVSASITITPNSCAQVLGPLSNADSICYSTNHPNPNRKCIYIVHFAPASAIIKLAYLVISIRINRLRFSSHGAQKRQPHCCDKLTIQNVRANLSVMISYERVIGFRTQVQRSISSTVQRPD